MTALVELTQFVHRYPGAAPIVAPDFALAKGERLMLCGPSGCGKTTLLLALAGMLTPAQGAVRIAGQDWRTFSGAAADRRRGRLIGFVPQEPHLIASLSVADNLRLAMYLAGAAQDGARLEAALVSLDVVELAGRYPHQLSRGQQQRVALARAVVNRPPLLLADEPTASLDDDACAAALGLLFSAAESVQAALIVATHDRRVRERFARALDLGAISA